MLHVDIMSLLYIFRNVATMCSLAYFDFISLMFVATAVELGMVCG